MNIIKKITNKKRIKFIVAISACFVAAILSAILFSVFAANNKHFYSSRTESSEEALFECNSSAGWVGYKTADHWTLDENGAEIVAYCIQHKYDPPTGSEDYRIVNGADYYSADTLTGLQIISSYGYPNSTGGFTEHEARYATCSAIRWWLAEQEDSGKVKDPDAFYNYDNLKNGNIRPKKGNEALFNWAVSLLKKARAQVEMEHSITLTPKSIELKDDGKGNYTGTLTVSLINCNGGYKVPDSSVKKIEKMGGTISGVTGNNNGKINISVPKNGNANRDIKLTVIGIDNRVPGNFIFAEPDRNKYPQTGEGKSSRQRMYAVFQTRADAADTSLQLTTPKTSIVSIVKVDEETGRTPQGDAVLTGAEFRIVAAENIAGTNYKAGDTVIELIAGKKVELFPGKYKIIESKVPIGYSLNTQPKEITIAEAGKEYSFEFADKVIKRPIAVVKFLGENISKPSTDNTPQISEANAEFQLILKSTGKIMDVIKTDDRGYSESKPLPYGVYTIHQTKGAEGHAFLQDTDVIIHENMPDTPYLIIADNYTERMPLRIIKVDAETGKRIAIAGAKFKIKDSKGNYISQTVYYPQTQTINEWITDSSGTVQLPNTLPYGIYSIVELEAPEGYSLNNKEISFKVSKTNASKEDPLFVEVNFSDTPIKGIIQINKIGNQFVGVKEIECEYGKLYLPEFELRGLEGAVFDVIAAEDIIVNGDVKVAAGEVVDTVTTTSDKTSTKELYLGKYKIVEKQAPEGYVLSTDEIFVELQSEGQKIPVVKTTVEISNKYQTAKLEFYKDAEIIESNPYDNSIIKTDIKIVPGEGFIFGLYADEDLQAVNKQTVIKRGSLIDTAKTDEYGKLIFEGTYPHGKYYIKEIYANSDYKENLTEYPVDLSYNNNTEQIFISLNNKPILNEIKKIPMTITKYDITGEKTISGTTIEVFDENGKVIYRDITKEDGTISDILVKEGQKYTFREVLSAEGYALNTAIMTFEVTEDGKIIGDNSIKDDYSRYELLKTDEMGNPLAGCEFGLFDINNNLIMTAVSDTNGIVRFEKIPFGEFIIKETKTIENYQLSDRVIKIKVDGNWINDTEPTIFKNIPVIKTGISENLISPLCICVCMITIIAVGVIYSISKKKSK